MKHRLGVALLSAALLFGAAPAVTPALADKASNTIRFAYDQVPENIDPFFNNMRAGVIIAHHVWDTLVYRDPTTNEYKGQLAASWKQIDDKTIEFDLRRGVKFHDGTEFTADDVVFTLNFVSKPENKVTTQANVNWIDRAEKLDTYKVRLVTKETFPAAIEYLAGPVVIHPAKYYEKVGPRGMNEKPIGTGPFKVTSHVIGKSVVLERNADYFKDSPKPQPKVAKVDIRFIPDRQTQIAEVLSGGLDFIMNVPKDQAEQMANAPGFKTVAGETMRIAFLHFNSLPDGPVPAFRDVKVRQAINHAIDKDAIVKNLVGGGSRALTTPCFFSQFGCTDEGATKYPYDPAKARALLKEAGVSNLSFDFYVYRERSIAEALINYLQAAGIKANLRFMQYAAMRDQMRTNKAALGFQTWGSFSVNDVSASTPVYFGGSSDDISHDKEIQGLLKTGDSSVDPAVRKDAYKKALTLITERAYTVPLYSVPTYYVSSDALTFKAYPDELPRFWEMTWK
ncbi:ABC transporter substrate-binding protein [Enterovirga rhinocerotis]|uniref:Peptide/nickel transport system substrate-binding protein n=1 Tax=Enterovirga rhinocerotis TaxID=1339210 RepID=A0A4V3DXK3_9HYPH|nr:ABC transporter substrate-binding protein [Enterovirga rhinocerotis]TDR89089.1 peptide/nickel transport system substrate-binding protein [Enterovirga rhinocerotis]